MDVGACKILYGRIVKFGNMNDIACPYCKAEQNICHDDGFGYEEDVIHRMQCNNCDKYFIFTTSILYCYYPEKADCLNGADHDWVPTTTCPIESTKMECIMCGDDRPPTPEEFEKIMQNAKKET